MPASRKKKPAAARKETRTAASRQQTKTRKKRTGRKRGVPFSHPLLMGILIGFIMACVGAWGVYSVLKGRQAVEISVSGQGAPGSGVSGAGHKEPPRPLPAPKGTSEAKGKIDHQPVPGITLQERAAVSKALEDLQNLPYEENLEASAGSLDERIRQVDYAFLQAGLVAGIPAGDTRFSSRDDHHHQDVDILPGADAEGYLRALRKALAIWAGDAALRQVEPHVWTVSLGTMETHRLRFYPGRTEFPPADSRAVPAGKEGKRTRLPGQAARMVIVIDDLGESKKAVKDLLGLNFPVTFAFWPFSAHAREGALEAHRAGREILVHYPMQPVGYPKVNAGPGVLLVGMEGRRIQALVEEGIARVPHAAGLNNHMGSRFTQDQAGVDQVLSVLKRKGMFVLDSLTHNRSILHKEAVRLGLTVYKRNIFLDHEVAKTEILAQLKRAERIAQLTGQSVAIGHPHPETLQALKEWQRLRDADVRLVRLRDLQPE